MEKKMKILNNLEELSLEIKKVLSPLMPLSFPKIETYISTVLDNLRENNIVLPTEMKYREVIEAIKNIVKNEIDSHNKNKINSLSKYAKKLLDGKSVLVDYVDSENNHSYTLYQFSFNQKHSYDKTILVLKSIQVSENIIKLESEQHYLFIESFITPLRMVDEDGNVVYRYHHNVYPFSNEDFDKILEGLVKPRLVEINVKMDILYNRIINQNIQNGDMVHE